MKTFQLTGTPRTELGKKAAKTLRKGNMIPAVLYGGEKETKNGCVYAGRRDGETPGLCNRCVLESDSQNV